MAKTIIAAQITIAEIFVLKRKKSDGFSLSAVAETALSLSTMIFTQQVSFKNRRGESQWRK
jgi:hypothetical protein